MKKIKGKPYFLFVNHYVMQQARRFMKMSQPLLSHSKIRLTDNKFIFQVSLKATHTTLCLDPRNLAVTLQH